MAEGSNLDDLVYLSLQCDSDESSNSEDEEENLARVVPYRFEPVAQGPRQNRPQNPPVENRVDRQGNTAWYD